MSIPSGFDISERDEAGRITKRYVASENSRVDVIYPQETKSYAQQLVHVFLPVGYPQSVTDDYIQYQIYDSLQAFSSSIAGMLSSRAVLQGVGVGDASASPTAALLLSVLQESMGRVATILFAHRLGTALEPECKMYRLAADVFNDTAMVLDCLSPAFPKPFRVAVLGLSSVLRSICGVCAGSAKASLSAHFAKKGNLGELNAKDSSQETVISLLGMLAGSIVVSWVRSPMATWSALIALLSIHLATNYAAVRAVSMRSLNRQRANIVFSNMLQHGKVLSPSEVSERERVFEKDGVLRWVDDTTLGYCRIGVTLEALMSRLGQQHVRTKSLDLQNSRLAELLEVFVDQAYILWYSKTDREALVVLKEGCTAEDQLKAWAHSLLLAQRGVRGGAHELLLPDEKQVSREEIAEIRQSLNDTADAFGKSAELLKQRGWDLNIAALETRAGKRVVIENRSEK